TRKTWSGKANMKTYHSDDGGRTWKGDTIDPTIQQGGGVTLQEPEIVELKDGRLLMFIRTDGGSQFQSVSEDSGMSWSAPVPGPLKSPVSRPRSSAFPG